MDINITLEGVLCLLAIPLATDLIIEYEKTLNARTDYA